MTLDGFVAEIQKELKAFADDYRAEHARNPQNYPLDLPEDNSGLWLEFFIAHCQEKTSAAEIGA